MTRSLVATVSIALACLGLAQAQQPGDGRQITLGEHAFTCANQLVFRLDPSLATHGSAWIQLEIGDPERDLDMVLLDEDFEQVAESLGTQSLEFVAVPPTAATGITFSYVSPCPACTASSSVRASSEAFCSRTSWASRSAPRALAYSPV